MTNIFVAYSQSQSTYIEQLRTALESEGYTTWRAPAYPTPANASYPMMIEQAVLGCAVLVLVWSREAAQDQWIERQVLFAQELKKPICLIELDDTVLPNMLVDATPISSWDAHGKQKLVTDITIELMTLPAFPPAQSSDTLIKFSELAVSPFISERKAAIDLAAKMLKQDEQWDTISATLLYLAQHDLIMGVREKAQEVLDAGIQRRSLPPDLQSSQDTRHIFGVRCKNGHVSYFDKRLVCIAHREIPRSKAELAGKNFDKLLLNCTTCGVEVSAMVDCEVYK